MMMKMNLAGAVLATSIAFTGAASAEEFITIGTGGVTGVYYPTGGAICRLVNKGRKDHGIRCSVESTGGSVYNTRTIRQGELDFGVVQSDVQAAGLNGTGAFKDDGAYPELRAIFSVHPEPMHVMARADAGINSPEDLKGKKVNIGNPGSGSRATVEALLKRKGWTETDFSFASELKAAEQAQALCDNKLDAIIYVVGHPSGSIKEATTSCESVVVDVAGPEVETLVNETPYYSKAVIPGGMYSGTDHNVNTFGMKAVFVSSADVDDETIYQVTKAVLSNFDNFKRLHAAFQMLEISEMAKAGLVAPLHPGSERFFREILKENTSEK